MVFRSLVRSPVPSPAAGDLVEVAGRPVRLKVHASARRVSLRVDPKAREVVATAPSARKLPDAIAFARTRADWIAERLDALPRPTGLVPGQTLRLGGEQVRLERARMRIAPRLIPGTAEEPARLLAYGEGAAYGRAVERKLKAEALERLTARTQAHVTALGVAAPSIAVMDAKARWGSCYPPYRGSRGRVRYNWRLVLAPPEVLDYVAAHECAHLLEANHGPRFWALVKRLYGDPARARAWLRAHGAKLHAVG